jgi:hypothetical protein
MWPIAWAPSTTLTTPNSQHTATRRFQGTLMPVLDTMVSNKGDTCAKALSGGHMGKFLPEPVDKIVILNQILDGN